MTRKANKDHAGVQGDFLDDFLDLGGDDINFVLRGTFTHVCSWTIVKQPICILEVDADYRSTSGVQAKHQKELDAAELSLPTSYLALEDLPYLDACIQESIRVHPGVGLILERVVPKGGVRLPDGPYVAEGTIVGITPWVVHLDEKIYSSDSGDFRAARWLPDDGERLEDFDARKQAMRETELTFGADDRVCLGK
ncbi:hypothetical protein EPUS_05294 [Endocarpon pusillum Z07020]|uniref:Cytochrome P450 n=1 Tax=Endocarpon pusillum (strain Z07020 / HMAS-L-300199) TaxID=1263415 RepID=U1G8A3_ENDPU|nr:uncharacterized protein EPUS_05294 [Endocarpon pusillum Z07020]ERF68213.1 hypothetical protein EPUS_05294 [Endocarpon pusillum Z07020]